MRYTDPGEQTKKRRKPKDDATADLFQAGQPVPRNKPSRGAPYQPASESSREAAERITPKASDLRSVVLMAITACGEHGATRRELEQSTGILTQTLTPRLNELEHEGRIVKHSVINSRFEQETVRRGGCSVYRAVSVKASAA